MLVGCQMQSPRNFTGGFPSWPLATCKFSTRRSFDHHGKGSGNFVQKKCFEKWKKVVSLIDLKVMKTRNDCEIACDCVKRANVVLYVGLCKEIFARNHTATHKPTSAQPLTATSVTSNNRLWSPQGLRPSGAIIVHVFWQFSFFLGGGGGLIGEYVFVSIGLSNPLPTCTHTHTHTHTHTRARACTHSVKLSCTCP